MRVKLDKRIKRFKKTNAVLYTIHEKRAKGAEEFCYYHVNIR